MKTILKFLLLVVLLNLVRYFIGGPIEGWTIMEPMHRVMPEYPVCFNTTFTSGESRGLFRSRQAGVSLCIIPLFRVNS